MSLPTSILLYEDIQAVMDQALSADIGLSLSFKSYGDAIHFRQRCYKFRALLKEKSVDLDKDDPMRGTTVYDTLVIYVRKGKPIAEIRKREAVVYEIQELKA